VPRALNLTVLLAVVACASQPSRAQQPPASPASPVPTRPLANLAAQRLIVAPVSALDQGDPMGWAAAIARPRAVLRALDSVITAEFEARGLRGTWFFAPDLEKSYQINSTYATNPYMLAEMPLRRGAKVGTFYTDPLASQLRTMIAMQDGARYVMLPVDLRFEKVGAGPEGRAVLKLVMVDARATEIMWVHEITSDPAPAFGPAVLASLATHFADLVASP
jgi:hypothetical protein